MTQANASSHVHDKMRRTPLSLVLGQGASSMDGRVFKPGVEEQGRANKLTVGVEQSGRRPLVCFLFLYISASADFSSAGATARSVLPRSAVTVFSCASATA